MLENLSSLCVGSFINVADVPGIKIKNQISCASFMGREEVVIT